MAVKKVKLKNTLNQPLDYSLTDNSTIRFLANETVEGIPNNKLTKLIESDIEKGVLRVIEDKKTTKKVESKTKRVVRKKDKE